MLSFLWMNNYLHHDQDINRCALILAIEPNKIAFKAIIGNARLSF